MGTSALLLLLALLLQTSPAGAQEGGNQAGLIIVQGDGRTVTRCVAFDEPQISGLTLLERAGLTFQAQAGPMGSTICTLNGEGCPTTDCFCQCKGLPCVYWNYYHRNADGSWAYSGLGAVTWQVQNGDVDAWVWGESGQQPPVVSFEAICAGTAAQATPPATQIPATEAPAATVAPPTPTPADTATPTARPSATPTATPEAIAPLAPVASPSPTATVRPAATPTETPVATPSPGPTEAIQTAMPTPTPTPAPQPAAVQSPPSAPPVQYIVFGALVVLGGAAFVLLRAKREPRGG